jgi:hypothetical protein
MNILPFTLPEFAIGIPIPKTTVILSAPTKNDYYRMTAARTKHRLAGEMMEKYSGTSVPLLPDMGEAFINEYLRQINEYREKNMDYLMIPETISFDTPEPDKLPVMTCAENAVYIYSGLDFIRQAELNIIEYWMILADSMKAQILRTKDGKDYLNECWHDMHRISTLECTI